MGGQASCQDLARFGLLALNEGTWDGEQVVSADYLREATHPSQDLNTVYGFLWWLNSDGRRVAGLDGAGDPVVDDGDVAWPDAPPDTYAAQGLGGQLAIVDPSEGLVITRLGPTGQRPGRTRPGRGPAGPLDRPQARPATTASVNTSGASSIG